MALPNRALKVDDNLHYALIPGEALAVLINEEITDFTQSANPETTDKHFIGEQNKRTQMTAYAPTVSYAGALNPTDPFCLYLYEIGKDEKLGESFDEYEVETWNSSTAGKYVARKHVYEVQPSNPGSGAGGDDLKIEGTLSQKGSVIKGTFDMATKAFTPDPIIV